MNSNNLHILNNIDNPPCENEKAHLTREVLHDLFTTIGVRNPESGGLLLGPIDEDGISSFVFDNEGHISCASYSPSSDKLTSLCEKAAKKQGLEMKGFCHSHPGNLGVPSSGDISYVKIIFDANPGMQKFYMPIMINTPLSLPKRTSDNIKCGFTCVHIPIPIGAPIKKSQQIPADWQDYLRFYVVYRTDPEKVIPAEVVLCNQSDFPQLDGKSTGTSLNKESGINLEILKRMLKRKDVIKATIPIDGHEISCIDVINGDTQLSVLIPTEFPVLQPTVLITKSGAGSYQFRFSWAFDDPMNINRRLADLINTALTESLEIF